MREHSLPPRDGELRGHLQIGKFSTNDYARFPRGQGFSIRVVDDASGSAVCDVYMTMEAFAQAINSQADCVFELRPAHAGKVHEHKNEVLALPDAVKAVPYCDRQDERTNDVIDAWLAPYEVDGWVARRSDIWNSHRASKAGQSIGFDRYVEAQS